MPTPIIFHTRRYRETVPKVKGSFILTSNSWDDYGTVCLFDLTYVDEEGRENLLGDVKILQASRMPKARKPNVVAKTTLEAEFKQLPPDCISLGQSEDYYANIRKLVPRSLVGSLLAGLRDIVWRPQLAAPFETTSQFRNAMLRNTTAEQARRFGRAIVSGEPISKSFSFSYSTTPKGAAQPVKVEVGFDAEDKLPGRVVCIVGRNAVGKTQILANLAQDLVQIRKISSERKNDMETSFAPVRPLFTRVIAISYSAFDRFARPKPEATSYVYGGIRNEKGAVSRTDLLETFRRNLQRVTDAGRERIWQLSMTGILGSGNDATLDQLANSHADLSSAENALSILSSGQAILAHFVTALVAWLEPNSLVLFDEPETHLHPNAVANLFNFLWKTLDRYDSYALVATHSPLVLQEIPSKRTIVLEREGNVTVARKLGLESFGESVSELTRHVFETVEIPTLYRSVFRQLALEEDIETTLGRFEKELSLHAQAFLIGQHDSGDE